ncbi:MAG: hypothetical protein JW963_14460 [Anaerolineales bacterium]|nr:hypothetical protein [Anaerolineales bacterium]
MDTFSLIPGVRPENPGPLARFLPPLEDGVISTWLGENIEPGGWLLDPFGSAPRMTLEAARAGYRVLVAANNPITRFMLEMGTSALPKSEYNAALAALAVSRKGDEKLEDHLQALYLTTCTSCTKEVPAQAFLWRKGEAAPFGRIYECQGCGESGEKLAIPEDAKRAAEIAKTAGLARARVLERVAPLDDPDREYAEEAIRHYLPRTIYALGTLINRLDGLQISEERRRALTALILSACDRGNALWPHPTERPRPKQLSTPPQFREGNIWLALEGAISVWAGSGEPVPTLRWGDKGEKLPQSGGILLYEGRIKDLAEVIKEAPIQAVIGAIPRPNQAFWTLSALWAGWLWGREAAEPFKVALRRRRYDWGWQAAALHAALHHVFDLLPLSTPFFGLLAEAEPGFLSATLTAASTAGFDLRAQAMRTAHDPIQLLWQRGERLHREKEVVSLEAICKALQAHLRDLGEPAAYLQLHAAGLAEQAQGHGLMRPEQDFDEVLREVQSNIQGAIQSDVKLERMDSEERSLEIGLWDLKEGETRAEPLADRVEQAVVTFLQRHPSSTLLELERGLYPEFPGLLTPSKALVGAVLESYGLEEGGRWRLRDEDSASQRRAELKKMIGLIETIGGRLGYRTEHIGENACLWKEKGKIVRVFYLLASAMTGRILAENQYPLEKCLLVLPGGRAGLLAYKETRDPRLRKRLEGWRILKFRLLRSLADIPVLNRQTFDEQLVSDPVEQTQGQMMMF